MFLALDPIKLKQRETKLFLFSLITLAIFISLLIFDLPLNIYLTIILLFLGILIVAMKLEIGLYLIAFFLPVINWNFYYGSLEVPFIDLLGLGLMLAFILRSVYAVFFSRAWLYDIKIPVVVPYLIFFSGCLISGWLANDAWTSLWYALRWILFFYLVYLLVPVNIIKNEKVLKNVVLFGAASAVIGAGLGLYSLLGQDFTNSLPRIKNITLGGIYPLGENQNLLVEILLPGIGFLLALKYWFTSERASRLINLLIIVLVLVLIGTFSRGGWLALAFGALVYIIMKYGYGARKFLAPAFFILLLFIPFYLYMYRLQTNFYVGVGSDLSRSAMNQIAEQAFLDKPIFGQGPGTFYGLVEDNIRFRARFGEPLDAHGIWQKVLAENGLFGVISFAILLLWIFHLLLRTLKRHKDKIDLLLPLLIGALSIVVYQFFNTSYYKGKTWLPIAIALAAANIIRQEAKAQKNNLN